MIDVNNISAVRGERLLFENCAFRLNDGQVLYIRGQNGAGKTTLLRMLCGLVRPNKGTIMWNDQNIYDVYSTYCRQFVYVGHENGIKGDLTAGENIQFYREFHGASFTPSESEIMDRLGIAHCTDIPCRYLSAGQKRRVALSRVLSSDASLWLLDEPFTALDESMQNLFVNLLAEHQRKGGICVATSHQPVHWEQLEITELNLSQVQ